MLTKSATTAEPRSTGNGHAAEVSGLDALELGVAADRGRRARMARTAWQVLWPKLMAIALVVAAWQAVFLSGWRPPYVLPSPSAVFTDLVALMATPEFGRAIAITMQRALTGFLLAVAIGTVVGGSSRCARPSAR
jgi:NitT/TauT family transport system permease protein